MADQASVRPTDDDNLGTEPRQAGVTRAMIDPGLLGYLMGPLAFGAILLLMRFGYITRESAWLWFAVFLAVPTCNLAVDRLYDRHPDSLSLNVRVSVQVAAVSAVIFLTGWGPVLWGAYAFIALEVIAKCGSRSWLSVAVWSLVGMVVGEVGIWMGWLPSELSVGQSVALTTMGAFVLIFVIRMAGATMEQKEAAEAAVRLSEDRFRSLIQNFVRRHHDHRPGGRVPLSLPRRRAAARVPARRPGRADGHGLRPPGRPGLPATAPRRGVPDVVGHRRPRIPHGPARRQSPGRRGGHLQPARPAVGGRIRHQRPRHHRAEEVRGPPVPPRPPRPADRSGQPPAHPGPGRPDAGPGEAHPRPGGGVLRRPRQLQGHQRLPGPRGGRPPPPGRRRAGSSDCSAPATPWVGWAATSSSSWPRVCR